MTSVSTCSNLSINFRPLTSLSRPPTYNDIGGINFASYHFTSVSGKIHFNLTKQSCNEQTIVKVEYLFLTTISLSLHLRRQGRIGRSDYVDVIPNLDLSTQRDNETLGIPAIRRLNRVSKYA